MASNQVGEAAVCRRVRGRVLDRPHRVQERMREQEKVQEEVQKGQEQVQELVRVQIRVQHLVRRQYDPRLWLVVVRVERGPRPKLLHERGAEEQVQQGLRSLPLSRRARRDVWRRSRPTVTPRTILDRSVPRKNPLTYTE